MCEDCECKEDVNNACCLRVSDKRWLHAFDRLAAEYPIDFYTESSFATMGGKSTDILFREFLVNTTLACHKKSARGKREYTDICPTENVRWHSVDVRTMGNYVEGNIISPFAQALRETYHYLSTMIKPQTVWEYVADSAHLLRAFYVPYYHHPDEEQEKERMRMFAAGIRELATFVLGSEGLTTIQGMNEVWWSGLRHLVGQGWKSGIFKQVEKITIAPYNSQARDGRQFDP